MQGQHKPKDSLQSKLGGSASPQQESPLDFEIIGLGKTHLLPNQTETVAMVKYLDLAVFTSPGCTAVARRRRSRDFIRI